jgi:hypothetical protein
MRPVIESAVLLLLLTAFADKADACSCISSGPPCQGYFQVEAVFAGTVQTISPVEGTPDSPNRGRVVVFAIERAFRGVQGTTAEITTGMGGGDCGYPFEVGERYLVYAYREKEASRLGTGICTRTRPIADAAEDLRYIEGLPAAGTGARVYGAIRHWERDPATGQSHQYGPVPFLHVLLRGPAGAVEAQTDEQGRYEIAGLPAGSYELQVIPPAAFSSKYLRSKIELRDSRACAVADFAVHYDGRISGVVLTADGQPRGGVALDLVAVERAGSADYVGTMTTKTDSGGYFDFSEVPPGQYVVGVSLRRGIEPSIVYPTTFYPGTRSPSDATVIEIGEGNHQQLEAFRLPPARQRRELMGRVVGSDGRPVPGAFVSLSDGDLTWRQVAVGIGTDADGQFTFVVHDGLSYTARATYNIPDDPAHRQVQASVGPFVASAQLASLRLVLVAPANR